MRFSAAAILLCLGAAIAVVSAQDDYDYGEDAAAAVDEKPQAPAPAPRRPAIPPPIRKSPLSRSRTPVTPPPPPPPPPPQEESESEEEAGDEEDIAPVTEASTKKPLVRGGVRPFRSNQDLLEALKRRRQNVRVSTHAPEEKSDDSSPTPAPSQSSRRRFNGGRATAKAQPVQSETEESSKSLSKPTRNGRRFQSRGRVNTEEEEQAAVEEPKRTGRRRF